jgi:hypothetical protein
VVVVRLALAVVFAACGGAVATNNDIASCLVHGDNGSVKYDNCYDFSANEKAFSEQSCAALAAFGKSEYTVGAACATANRTGSCDVPGKFTLRCYPPTTTDACRMTCIASSGTFSP